MIPATPYEEGEILHELQVKEEGERIDRWICAHLPELTRTRIQILMAGGRLELNGKPGLKPSYRVRAGDRIRLRIPPPQRMDHLQPQSLPLDILYEDADFLVLNKPPRQPVHPGPGHALGTLVNALLAYSPTLSVIAGALRPGIVHRLDMDTSGTMVVAKNDFTHLALKEQFKAHTVKKIYWALVAGIPPWTDKEVRSLIDRHPVDRKRRRSGSTGKEAITHFRVLETFGSVSWLSVELLTGRTHQIRVHASEMNHPVVGDTLYGNKKAIRLMISNEETACLKEIKGQALHCRTLGFTHPRTDQWMEWETLPPEGFRSALECLKKIAGGR